MAMNENNLGFPLPANSTGRLRGSGLHPLHEAAMRLAGMGINRPRERTKDLVTMLLSHGARAWRHAQPEANIHLHISPRAGKFPLRLRVR